MKRDPASMLREERQREVARGDHKAVWRAVLAAGAGAVLCEVIGEPIKRLAYVIGEPIRRFAYVIGELIKRLA